MKLGEIGFAMVAYPVSLIFRIVQTMQRALTDLKGEKLNLEGEGVNFDEFKEMIGFNAWSKLEQRFSSNDLHLKPLSGNSQDPETSGTAESTSINFRHV